jgi:hypothetical protein
VIFASHVYLPGISDPVQFSECGQRVAERDAFGKGSSVLALVVRQDVESLGDGLFRMLDALPQSRPAGLEQRNVEEFAPIYGGICGHESILKRRALPQGIQVQLLNWLWAFTATPHRTTLRRAVGEPFFDPSLMNANSDKRVPLVFSKRSMLNLREKGA